MDLTRELPPLEGIFPLPLEDPGDRHLEILDGIELSPDPRVARLQRRIALVAERCLAMEAKRPPQDEPTTACPDCQDAGWILVPCRGQSSDRKRPCSACASWKDHRVLRACLTCDQGRTNEAGIWFRRIARRDRRGKPSVDELRVKAFDRAMLKIGPPACVTIRAELDRMLAGESERQPEEPR